ncbi:MAG: nucleotide exchange factor GrpE [Aestuariivita sp.]|nr:nucleotide exchange factor GrpE [Aestuariivita sp.]
MTKAHSNWKSRVLGDFSNWIENLTEIEEEVEGSLSNGPDLHDLFSAVTTLRQEIRLQNREQSKAERELGRAAERYDEAVQKINQREGDLRVVSHRAVRQAENICLRSFLEMHDTMLRGHSAAEKISDDKGFFRRLPPGIEGIVEGYEIAMRRFDRIMAEFDVYRIEAVGQTFDSKTMHALETRFEESIGDNIVIEELLPGYMRDDDVLRLADVVVNRILNKTN